MNGTYRYCGWIAARHDENFPVASRLLPRRMRPHVAAVYAFARSADDFADEKRYEGRSLELLQQWRKNLWAACNGAAGGNRYPVPIAGWVPGTDVSQHPIFLALADTVRRCDLPVRLLDDLLTAFIMDVTQRRYADWDELLTYCRYSANPVGRLVLLLCGIRDEELHRRSDDICTALQLANHWQDLAIDLARDILYIPQDLINQHGVSEADLLSFPRKRESGGRIDPRFREDDVAWTRFQALMKELVNRARALFDSGEPLVRHLNGGFRLEIALTLAGGRAILDKIEAAGYDVFRRRPVLSAADKLCLLTRAVFSN